MRASFAKECSPLQLEGGFSRAVAGATIEDAFAGCYAAKPGVVLLDATFPDAKTAAKTPACGARRCPWIILAIEESAETVIKWVGTVKGVVRGE